MDLETLDSTINSTRTARDRAALAAEKAAILGIPTFSAELASLAASYDKLLADLLVLREILTG